MEGWIVWVKPVQLIWRQMELLEGGWLGMPWLMALLPVTCLVTELRGLKSFQAPCLHLTAPHTASSSSVLKYPLHNLAQA